MIRNDVFTGTVSASTPLSTQMDNGVEAETVPVNTSFLIINKDAFLLRCKLGKTIISIRTVYLEVLDECLWPTVQQYFADGGYIFHEDNPPTHKANLVKRYFQEKNTIPILWPMYSPDLSPIDNCWSLVKMRLQKEIH